MIEAEEARGIAIKHTRIQTMLRYMEERVEVCIRNRAYNGHMDVDIDLYALASDTSDPEIKDRVVDTMLSELKMMGYHVDLIKNSKMYMIDWMEEDR